MDCTQTASTQSSGNVLGLYVIASLYSALIIWLSVESVGSQIKQVKQFTRVSMTRKLKEFAYRSKDYIGLAMLVFAVVVIAVLASHAVIQLPVDVGRLSLL